jgi:multiple sugar transport system substrate-binding protein
VHHWAWQNGANVLKQPDLTEFVLNSPEGVESVQFQVDLINKHKVAPLEGEILQDDVSDFHSGRVAMFEMWGNFEYLGFKEKKHIDIVHPPKNKVRVGNVHSNSLAISSKAKAPELAFNWLSSMTNKSGDLDQAKFSVGIVLRQSNLGTLEQVYRETFGVEHPEVITDLIATGRPYDITPVHSEIEQAFNPAMDEVRLGRKSPQDALNAVKPTIDAILAKAR